MPLELSILSAFLAMFCWGVGDFLIQRTVRKIGNIQALAFIGIIGAIFLLPFVWNEIPLFFSTQNAVLLLGLGVINFFVAVLNFEALKQGKLSVIDLILAVELPLTILFGLVFFRESLSVFQSLIIAVIFFGIILTSISSFSKKILKNLEKGVLIALATAIGMALVNFLTAAGSKTISPLMAIWVPWLVFTAVSLFYLWRKNKLKNFVENGFKHKKLVFLTGFFDTFAWVFFAMAVFQNPLSITTAITEAFPIVAMFLGFFVNKEKIFGHQLLGATLTLAGIFVLAILYK